MKELLSFQSVYIPYQFDANELGVGILFDSKWENEFGVAVKIINGKVSEIGYQDIIEFDKRISIFFDMIEEALKTIQSKKG